MCWLSWNLGASISWNPQDLSRPVMSFLYLSPDSKTNYLYSACLYCGKDYVRRTTLNTRPETYKTNWTCCPSSLNWLMWRRGTLLMLGLCKELDMPHMFVRNNGLVWTVTWLGIDTWSRKLGVYFMHCHGMLDEAAEKPGIVSCYNLTTGVTDVHYIQMCQLLHPLPN